MNYRSNIYLSFRRTLLSIAVAGCLGAGTALAQPVGPQVINGSVNFASQGNALTITNSPNAIINWQGFSIAPNEVTRFIQQSGNSNVLNRVVGLESSAILGALQSNGRVYLINPNGILFGPNARVDVNGLIASTLDIGNQDFLAGKYKFNAGSVAARLDNQGAITTPSGGQIVLIAPDLQNSGILTSPQGEILLAAGKSVQLVDTANPDLAVVVSAPDNRALNLGRIVAQGGKVGIYGALVNQRGKVSADSAVVGENGKIVFKASKDTLLEAGSVTSATGAGKGGEIQVLGERVGLSGDAQVDASGQQGGGTVLVGGDYQGKNPLVRNAQVTYVGAEAQIKADAIQNGNGGKVIVWADDTTRAYGRIYARGGQQSGDGGFVETSGKQSLIFRGKVDAGATNGKGGTLLLDPTNITIQGGTGDGTTDGTGTFQGSQTATVGQVVDGSGDAGPSTIYESELEGLPGGTSVILSASNSVTTSGTFTGGVTLPSNSSLSIYTTDVGGTGITLGTPFIASGTGTISVSAGNGGGGSAPLTVNNLTTSNRQIDLWAGGALSINGIVNSGTAQTNATAGSSVTLTGTGQIQSGLAVLTAPAITLNAVSSIAASNLTLNADSMNLGGSITATTNVSLIPKTIASAKIDVGGADNPSPLTLGLTAAELGTISSPHLTIGAPAGAGDITVSAPITLTGVNNLELLTAGNTVINDSLSVPASGSITIKGPTGDSTKSLTLAATKQIATGGSGLVELAYDKMTLNGTILNSGGDVMLTRSNSAVIPLEVNAVKPATPTQLELTPTELTHISAGKVLLGSSAKRFGNIYFAVSSPVDVHANTAELALYADQYPGVGVVTQDPTSPITVGQLTVSASQVNLDTAVNMVDAVQGNLVGTAGADFFFKNGKAVHVGKSSLTGYGIFANTGMGTPDIAVTTTSGDLSVDQINASGGTVTLNSASSIVDSNTIGTLNLTAATVNLSAVNGVSMDTKDVTALGVKNTTTNGIAVRNDSTTGTAVLNAAILNSAAVAPNDVYLEHKGPIVTASSAGLSISGITSGYGKIGIRSITPTVASNYISVASGKPVGGANTLGIHFNTDKLTVATAGEVSVASGGGVALRPYTESLPVYIYVTTPPAGCGTTKLCYDLVDLDKIAATNFLFGGYHYTGSTAPANNFVINSPLDFTTAGFSKVGIFTAGDITQSTSSDTITVANLGIRAGGNVDLTTAANAVGTLAAEVSTAGNYFKFKNGTGLIIGQLSAPYQTDTLTGVVNTSVAGGAIEIAVNTGDLQIPTQINAKTGAVNLTASGGSVYGSIMSPDIIAGVLDVSAYTNITGVSGLHTQVPRINSLAASMGLVNVLNFGGVILGPAVANAGTAGVTALGSITVTAQSPITVNGYITSSSGNIALTASGGSALTIDAPVTASSGTISLASGSLAGSLGSSYGSSWSNNTPASGGGSTPPPPPTLDQCVANPGAAGCSAILPTLEACATNPSAAGCSAVLPTLEACAANPSAPGCSAILPTLSACTANPSAPGCSAVLPSLSACAANPSAAGCAAVLPTLSACTANPSAAGCSAVLPSLSACAANPSAAGCSAILPTLNACTANPGAAGCSAVLPTLAACTASPAAAGCSAVLPTLDQCSAAPGIAGCTAILPAKLPDVIKEVEKKDEGKSLDQALNQSNNSLNNAALNSVVKPLTTVALLSKETPAETKGGGGGGGGEGSGRGAGSEKKDDEKADDKKDEKKDTVAQKEEKKEDAPKKKQYCN